MATTMPKAGEVDRKWYVLDAAGKPLGRQFMDVQGRMQRGRQADRYLSVSFQLRLLFMLLSARI